MQKSVFSIQQLPRCRSHCNLSLLPHKRATAGNGYCTILLLSFVQFVMQLLFRKSTAMQVSKKQLFQEKCFAAERLQTRKYMHNLSKKQNTRKKQKSTRIRRHCRHRNRMLFFLYCAMLQNRLLPHKSMLLLHILRVDSY